MSVAPAAPPTVWVDSSRLTAGRLLSRVATFCLVELQKLRHDRTELLTRAIQPVLWLVVFGVTFSHIHAIPTGSVPYLDYLAPGIIAQSALFVAIFYGIQIIWERDAGVLTKLLVTRPHGPRLSPARRSPPEEQLRRPWSSFSSPPCSA
jgi:ABC-2 type transport system permease protein